ncbi:hypothetical protein F2Q68_00020836 [Brassica cretica]|uniref:Uncharacterized protein n=2 Tax=Brassica cretica TaxID=69181 RepID=A0A8S9FSK3_BRACR|nr:hypothetical protein F2Q68_00020836 [Brassica cretica]KAF3548782.1 hypothetical protein DY000_02007621 [Brassica cretica]
MLAASYQGVYLIIESVSVSYVSSVRQSKHMQAGSHTPPARTTTSRYSTPNGSESIDYDALEISLKAGRHLDTLAQMAVRPRADVAEVLQVSGPCSGAA